MARKDIYKDAVMFSKEYQPSPEAKKEGWRRKRVLKDLATSLIGGGSLSKAKKMAEQIGVDLSDDEFSVDIVLTLRQIGKALKDGDTRAYSAAMDRMIGRPTQPVQLGVDKNMERAEVMRLLETPQSIGYVKPIEDEEEGKFSEDYIDFKNV